MILKEFITLSINNILKSCSTNTKEIEFDLIVSPNQYLIDGNMISVVEVIGGSTNDTRATTIKFKVNL